MPMLHSLSKWWKVAGILTVFFNEVAQNHSRVHFSAILNETFKNQTTYWSSILKPQFSRSTPNGAIFLERWVTLFSIQNFVLLPESFSEILSENYEK